MLARSAVVSRWLGLKLRPGDLVLASCPELPGRSELPSSLRRDTALDSRRDWICRPHTAHTLSFRLSNS
jgi:hypothetical protein